MTLWGVLGGGGGAHSEASRHAATSMLNMEPRCEESEDLQHDALHDCSLSLI